MQSFRLASLPFGLFLFALCGSLHARQSDGTVLSQSKISALEGGLTGPLGAGDEFGCAVVRLGDLDGDGGSELAVGALASEGGGAVWILFQDSEGVIRSERKIDHLSNGLAAELEDGDNFGVALAAPGDMDGDCIPDLVVGASADDDGFTFGGAIYILFLNADGTPREHRKISDATPAFANQLGHTARFGASLAAIGDLDGDGIQELAVGAPGLYSPSFATGGLWILFLDSDASLRSYQRITNGSGGLSFNISSQEQFGYAVTALDDRDTSGRTQLLVGAPDDGFYRKGSVVLLSLEADGFVAADRRFSVNDLGIFLLSDYLGVGSAVVSIGDLNGDGVGDAAIASENAEFIDGGGLAKVGGIWIVFFQADGSNPTVVEITVNRGGFTGELDEYDYFGSSLGALADHDGDGIPELYVGAQGDDDGVVNGGAVWSLDLAGVAAPRVVPYGKGANPPDSLVVLDGAPRTGSVVGFGVDNPLGTQPPGTLPLLFLSRAPDSQFPCGTLIPGLGMSGPGAAGELLVDVGSDALVQQALVGAPWSTPGEPVRLLVPVPALPALVGNHYYFQGLMWDPTNASGVRFALTNALEVIVGE